MSVVTRWFSIDHDGQPTKPGWYEVAYGDWNTDCDRLYWGGTVWRHDPEDGKTCFGNYDTSGESWRGLAKPIDRSLLHEEIGSEGQS